MKVSKRTVKRSIVALLITFGVIQLVPVARTNPPVESEVPATAEVRTILRRACYDCHSHETIWPGYSRIAPLSWLVVYDVSEGREELNFSTWNRLTPEAQLKAKRESWKEIEEGEMPPWLYLPAHPAARLSANDRAALRAWALAGENPPVSVSTR